MFFQISLLPVRRAAWWLFWPAVLVIVWGELTPNPPSEASLVPDKAEHFIAYFGLALLATLAWGLRPSLIWVYCSVVTLGGALEILQSLTGRDSEWLDQAVNAVAAILGMGAAIAYLAIPRHMAKRD